VVEQAGAVNAYRCPYGHVTVTVTTAEGVTPMFIPCAEKPCKARGTSVGYNQEIIARLPDPTPRWEWYRPQRAQLRRLRQHEPYVYQHCESGGLLLRRIR
jgi:hypothetical protein